jgi:hypothetical protein
MFGTISAYKTMFGSSLPPVVCLPPCLICVNCVRLSKVVSNTYCVVFLLCSSSPCVSYVVSFPALSICDCPALFFNVYLGKCKYDHHTWIISAIKDTLIIGQHKNYKKWATCPYHHYLVFSSAPCVLGTSLYDNKVCQLLTKCIRFSPVHNLPPLHSDYILNAGLFYNKIECYTHTIKMVMLLYTSSLYFTLICFIEVQSKLYSYLSYAPHIGTILLEKISFSFPILIVCV